MFIITLHKALENVKATEILFMTLQNSALCSMTSLFSLKLFIGLLPVYEEKKRHYRFFFSKG